MTDLKKYMDSVDLAGIRQLLSVHPELANENIAFDAYNTSLAHPLHRICDGVFAQRYTDQKAVEMARIFIEHGADVNGGTLIHKRDTPLIAAASLHADLCAILYIEEGANIHHAGALGGTALHWAAWCGRDVIVKRLVEKKAAIDQKCMDHGATPLFWALHGLKFGGEKNKHRQIECARILMQNGADISISNREGTTLFDLLKENDDELKRILTK